MLHTPQKLLLLLLLFFPNSSFLLLPLSPPKSSSFLFKFTSPPTANFSLGSPKQRLKAKVSFFESEFYFGYGSGDCVNFGDFDKFLFYDKKSSGSYKNLSDYKYSIGDYEEACLAEELMYFYSVDENNDRKRHKENTENTCHSDNLRNAKTIGKSSSDNYNKDTVHNSQNQKTTAKDSGNDVINIELNGYKIKSKLKPFQKVRFFLTSPNDYKFCPTLGMQLSKSSGLWESRSFLGLLKKSDVINESVFWFEFEEKEEGGGIWMVVGAPPHRVGEGYKEEDLKTVNSYTSPSKHYWGFEFKHVTLGSCSLDSFLYARVIPDYEGILCPNDVCKKFDELFFNEYYKENVCEKSVEEARYVKYIVVKCDKRRFTVNHISLFPKLQFYHQQLNFTFTLSGKDLFSETNNKIYFNIIQNNIQLNEWGFGRVFLKKYKIFFDGDNKIMGFYTGKNNRKNHNFLAYWMILVILLSLVVFLGWILLKEYRKKRKYRYANELEDEFRYEIKGEGKVGKDENTLAF